MCIGFFKNNVNEEIIINDDLDINDGEQEMKVKLDVNRIIQVDFPESQYYKTEYSKKQIVLHHTVSGQGVSGDINWWKQTPERIATCVLIDWKGDIYQLYLSKFWAHHLGTKASNNTLLNKQSIGIEIDSWGGLMKSNNNWHPIKWDVNLKKFVPNTSIRPIQDVVEYPNGFRGFYAFEKYTDEQIESVRQLLIYWNETYGIPLKYNSNMWDYSINAINGEPGIWAHVSYRKDKSDVHPQPELIQMLKSLY